MEDPNNPDVPAPLDDRSSFDVGAAALRTIAEYSELPDEDAVLRRIFEAKGAEFTHYLTTIARSNHSVFYHQLQELYDYGKELVDPDVAPRFCRIVGQEFARHLLDENLHPVQQVALAEDREFQRRIVDMVGLYSERYTGDKYSIRPEFAEDEIRLHIAYRRPEVVAHYLEEYELDFSSCLANSVDVIAGAVEHFVTHLLEGYDGTRFRIDQRADGATLHIPVRNTDRFHYGTLIQRFVGEIRVLEERQRIAAESRNAEDELILGSALMRDKWEKIRRAGRTDEMLLLRGESGTGKSFMARKIHELSPRRDLPFVEVALTSDVGAENMIQSDLFGHERGAFTGAAGQKKGLFSLAHGGTIFLDEIGDATPELQAKLLKVLETSRFRRLGGLDDIQVDVRVIAATNRDLEQMVEEGSFRRDLYYRLNVISLHLPPVRERAEEVPALARFLLERATREGRPARVLPAELAEELARYPWPGNIRELDHALRHAIAMSEGETLTRADFPPGVLGHLAMAAADAGTPPIHAASDTEIGEVIDREALRRLVRSTNPVAVGTAERKVDLPPHIDHARRVYLEVLIDELGGDLALIAQFWDRGSEKTLRNLIRSMGLSEHLAAARERRRVSS